MNWFYEVHLYGRKIADFYHIIYMAFGRKTDFYFFCTFFL